MNERKTDKLLPCLLRGRVYGQAGLLPYLHLLPVLFSYGILDAALRFTYRWSGMVGLDYLPANLFTIGWLLVLGGLSLCLPKWGARLLRWIPLAVFVVLTLTHSGIMSMFGRFFTFSALTFGGVGEFVETSYISFAHKVVAAVVLSVLSMLLAGRLAKVFPKKGKKGPKIAGLVLALAGAALAGFTHVYFFPMNDTVIWEDTTDPAVEVYYEYSDPTNSLMVSGLYQYTFRDLWLILFPPGALSDQEREVIGQEAAAQAQARQENEYTGRLAGKNVILVQLEAIDTWMLTEEYMPNLSKLKGESLSFANHYSPAYITAGTFNTEFIANTGLIPATGGVSTSVYADDAFPYSLANLFRGAGYTPNSFHNSEGHVYDRGIIHQNLGYDSYTGGQEMAMENYELDRYLINGYEAMTAADPFFSFVITYSGHGPYGEDNPIYQANKEAAQAAAARTDNNYLYAVAGAMETDRFIGSLVDKLTQSGRLEDTVLVFYADHYNYYMMNDAFLAQEIKNVPDKNMLQHTDFFIWSADLEPKQVDKVTSSLDILPTLANLFALDIDGAYLPGYDGLSDQGGYAFFLDGSWYDGVTYGQKGDDPARDGEISKQMNLSNRILAGNYYEK